MAHCYAHSCTVPDVLLVARSAIMARVLYVDFCEGLGANVSQRV